MAFQGIFSTFTYILRSFGFPGHIFVSGQVKSVSVQTALSSFKIVLHLLQKRVSSGQRDQKNGYCALRQYG